MSRSNTKRRKIKKSRVLLDTPTLVPPCETGTTTGRVSSLSYRAKASIRDVDYASVELRILARTAKTSVTDLPSAPSRDQHGYPVWPKGTKIVSGRHFLAGEFNKLCFRTICQRPEAVWYNRGSHKHYCAECAYMLNKENLPFYGSTDGRPMCIKVSKAYGED